MDRNQAKALLPIIQAYAEGKAIESRCIKGDKSLWYDDEDPSFDNDFEYRIKTEPRYRPFSDAEECWTEMKKHQPFGWVKDKKYGYYGLITAVDNGDYMSLSGNSGWSFYSLMKDYTFTDDIPFGIKVE